MTRTDAPAVVLAGTTGYGRRHLENLLRWHSEGVARLVALVDLDFSAETRRLVSAAGADPAWCGSIDEALDARATDLAVVATPPHTHFAIAETVLRDGTALYLEKPPVPLLQQLDVLAAVTPSPRTETGFQLARASIEAVEPALAAGTIGEVTRITAHGCLSRPDSYYTRNAWAGSWFAGGQAVLDGPLFNPLAHVVHTALTLARRIDPGWTPARVEAELYSVREIAGDDASAIRIRSSHGPEVLAVGTTAADEVREPAVTMHGSRGTATIRHADAAVFTETDGVRRELAAHQAPVLPLRAALRDPDGPSDEFLALDAVRPFVTVVNAAVEAVRAPASIARFQRAVQVPDGLARTLPGISDLIDRVVGTGRLFAELGAAWAGGTGSIDLRGYGGLSHPDLAVSSLPARAPAAREPEAR